MTAQIEAEQKAGRRKLTWFESGTFTSNVTLTWLAPRAYSYTPSLLNPFSFKRSNGQIIVPGTMITDAGTIPRICWLIPDLDPFHFLPAYLIHDWCFAAHHEKIDVADFAEANIILGEAIVTMIDLGIAAGRPLLVEAIYRAVGSRWGRELWDRRREMDR